MRTERIYIETSLINRVADPLDRDADIRREQVASREWWSTALKNRTYTHTPHLETSRRRMHR